jgi:hypothetical protein
VTHLDAKLATANENEMQVGELKKSRDIFRERWLETREINKQLESKIQRILKEQRAQKTEGLRVTLTE